MKAGKWIFSWHHWCGLIVGAFLLVMSLSGALLVFSDEMEAAYESPWKEVQNPSGLVSYDASFAAIRKQFPGWEIRLYGTPAAGEALVYDLRKGSEQKKVFVHPASGRVLHIDNQAHRQLYRQLLTLHYTLFAGTIGKTVVFFAGLLFLLTLVTGVYIYRKALLKVLTFRVRISRKTGRSFSSSLHRTVGVWSLLFNLLIVVTGLFISGKIVLTALGGPGAKKETATSVIRSIDRLKADLLRQHPTFQVHLIRVAANAGTVQFSGRFTSDPFYYGKYYSRFFANGSKGNIEKQERLREQGSFKKWQSITGPLHFGNYGGLPVKILYAFFGLMPGLLSITGFFIWQKKRRTVRESKNRSVSVQ